jgi:hypothetical protein
VALVATTVEMSLSSYQEGLSNELLAAPIGSVAANNPDFMLHEDLVGLVMASWTVLWLAFQRAVLKQVGP